MKKLLLGLILAFLLVSDFSIGQCPPLENGENDSQKKRHPLMVMILIPTVL